MRREESEMEVVMVMQVKKEGGGCVYKGGPILFVQNGPEFVKVAKVPFDQDSLHKALSRNYKKCPSLLTRFKTQYKEFKTF